MPYPIEFTYDQYVSDVATGKIKACKFIRQAVKRHIHDIEESRKKDSKYFFDEADAQRRIAFISMLQHTKGQWARENRTIKLEPWQQFLVASIFGWKYKDSHLRRFRRVFVEVGRKNGKTILASAIALAVFFLDNEAGCEIYCCATKKDQAKIAWEQIRDMALKVPALAKRIKVYKNNSVIMKELSTIKVIGKDSTTQDGFSPVFGLVDEYHAHKTNALMEVLESGMGAREQPMTFIITTAGADKMGPCFTEERDLAVRVLSGKEEKDNSFFLLYELDEDDDWSDISNAIKANPNLGVSVFEDFLKDRIDEGLKSPRKQALIRTKNFNQWVDSAETWIRDEDWDACGQSFGFSDMAGRQCYFGMDLSMKTDLSAVSFVFPPVDLEKEYHVITRFYMPEGIINEKSKVDHVPYATWRDQGWITCTDGATISEDWIKEDVLQTIQQYGLIPMDFGYDPWNAQHLVTELGNEGLSMVEFRQGFNTISPVAKDFEQMVLERQIAHDRNPILAWNVACCELEVDPAGNIKPSKKKIQKTSKRIDGVIATIMGIGVATASSEASMIDEGDLFVI